MALFAEVDQSNKVLRVVVCDTVEYLEQRLGGTWIETDDTRVSDALYAGIGMGYDPESLAKFAGDWAQPTAETPYPLGTYVFHNGLIWQSLQPLNVWEPGVFGWRDRTNQIPKWVQPLGAGDAFGLDEQCTHLGKIWQSNVSMNVWEPGALGITQWDEVLPETPPGNSGWVDVGVTVTQVGGANLLYVTSTVPFIIGSLVRVRGIEATVTSIFTAGTPGLLIITPDIRAEAGDIVELFVENLEEFSGKILTDSNMDGIGVIG